MSASCSNVQTVDRVRAGVTDRWSFWKFYGLPSWWTRPGNKSLSLALKHAGIGTSSLVFSRRMTRMKSLIWVHRNAWASFRLFVSQRPEGQVESITCGCPACLGGCGSGILLGTHRGPTLSCEQPKVKLKERKVSSSYWQLPKAWVGCSFAHFFTWNPWGSCHKPRGKGPRTAPFIATIKSWLKKDLEKLFFFLECHWV